MRDSDIQFPVVIGDFSPGWIADRDAIKIPTGGAHTGYNIDVRPDGSFGTSLQYEIVGTSGGVGSSPITSSALFKTRYDQSIEIYHAGDSLYYWNTVLEDYALLKSGLSSGAFFGFCQSSENTDFQDYEYMCNGIDNDMRWIGAHDKVATAIAGAATELEVSSSVFTSREHVSDTATSVTTTTVTLSSANWGTDSFIDYYVEIIDGANAGKISRISGNTSTTITFAAIAGLSGTPQFKIRQLRFEHSGTLVVGSQEIAYTGYVSSTKFAISGSYTVAQNAPVAQSVEEFPANPKGNMMLMKDGYRLVASTFSSTVYRSKTFQHSDFTFGSPRAPGEGDIIDVVEGTGNITGLVSWKGYFLITKTDLVKPYRYTDLNAATGAVDGNDIATSEPEDVREAPLIGGSYPLGTFTIDNAVVSCITGRGFRVLVAGNTEIGTDSTELSANISDVANNYVSDKAAGIQHLDEIWITTKLNSQSSVNDTVVVFNKKSESWSLPRLGWRISSFFEKDGVLYGTSSLKREVYKLNTVLDVDLNDGESYSTETLYVTGCISGSNPGKRSSFAHQYIRGRMNLSTELTVTRYLEKDGAYRSESARISNSLTPGAFVSDGDYPFLGSDELGSTALGGVDTRSNDDLTDMIDFIAYIEWKPQSVNDWQIAFSTSGAGNQYEIFEQAFNTMEEKTINKAFLITPGN